MVKVEIVEYLPDKPIDDHEEALWLANGWKYKREIIGEVYVDLSIEDIISALKAREKFERHRGKKIRLSRKNIVSFYKRKMQKIIENVISNKKYDLLEDLMNKLEKQYKNGVFSRATYFRLKKVYGDILTKNMCR